MQSAIGFLLMNLRRLTVLVLFAGLAAAAPAQQPAGHAHNSIPFRFVRLGAGTVKTMVYPRHHWKETIFLDVNFLMSGYDARASQMVYSECVGCAETNPFLGEHPSSGKIWTFKLTTAFGENMVTHALANKAREDHIPVVLAFLPAGLLGGASVYAGNYNYFSGYLLWRDCNRNPNCFPHHQ